MGAKDPGPYLGHGNVVVHVAEGEAQRLEGQHHALVNDLAGASLPPPGAAATDEGLDLPALPQPAVAPGALLRADRRKLSVCQHAPTLMHASHISSWIQVNPLCVHHNPCSLKQQQIAAERWVSPHFHVRLG